MSDAESQRLQDFWQKLSGFELKKKMEMLTIKLNAIQEGKTAGFSKLPTITREENVENDIICKKIIKELKLSDPFVKLYIRHLYS